MKITVEMVRNFNPCYDPTKVVPENWTGTALDVLNLPISADDRLWVVLREEVLPEATLREFARWCALQVINLWEAPDVVRKYLETGDETLRVAAWDAAQDASRAAAQDASDAAQDASRAAARAAAQDASDAAQDASRAAARAAARDAQIEKLKEMISK